MKEYFRERRTRRKKMIVGNGEGFIVRTRGETRWNHYEGMMELVSMITAPIVHHNHNHPPLLSIIPNSILCPSHTPYPSILIEDLAATEVPAPSPPPSSKFFFTYIRRRNSKMVKHGPAPLLLHGPQFTISTASFLASSLSLTSAY